MLWRHILSSVALESTTPRQCLSYQLTHCDITDPPFDLDSISVCFSLISNWFHLINIVVLFSTFLFQLTHRRRRKGFCQARTHIVDSSCRYRSLTWSISLSWRHRISSCISCGFLRPCDILCFRRISVGFCWPFFAFLVFTLRIMFVYMLVCLSRLVTVWRLCGESTVRTCPPVSRFFYLVHFLSKSVFRIYVLFCCIVCACSSWLNGVRACDSCFLRVFVSGHWSLSCKDWDHILVPTVSQRWNALLLLLLLV